MQSVAAAALEDTVVGAGDGVGVSFAAGVGDGVGVGFGDGDGVGFGDGDGVAVGSTPVVGFGVGRAVGVGVGFGVGVGNALGTVDGDGAGVSFGVGAAVGNRVGVGTGVAVAVGTGPTGNIGSLTIGVGVSVGPGSPEAAGAAVAPPTVFGPAKDPPEPTGGALVGFCTDPLPCADPALGEDGSVECVASSAHDATKRSAGTNRASRTTCRQVMRILCHRHRANCIGVAADRARTAAWDVLEQQLSTCHSAGCA